LILPQQDRGQIAKIKAIPNELPNPSAGIAQTVELATFGMHQGKLIVDHGLNAVSRFLDEAAIGDGDHIFNIPYNIR
jgi:hypothetical protein